MTMPSKNSPKQKQPTESESNPPKKTRLIVKYDCGFSNNLTLRGQGAGLNWHQGFPLKNVKSDEWLFETDVEFSICECKVLVNDTIYETGPNRLLVFGTQSQCEPTF